MDDENLFMVIFVDHINHCFNMVYWGVLQNSVPEVKDMSRATANSFHYVLHSLADNWYWGKQECWIKVSLY